MQQAILLIVIRGTQQPRWIAPKLGVSREDVVNSLDGIAGILVDANTKTIYFQ